jgi:hypothetical protein
MVLPKHYFSGLSKKNTNQQLNELKKSQNLYKKGVYHTRKKMDSFKSKKSRHVVEFEKKYCVNITNLKDVSRVTGLPTKALNKVIKKGMGAYYSSGSRPNQNAHSWAYARLASTLLKHNSYRVDKHIIDEFGGKIKPPPKKKCKKDYQKDKNKKIVSCCGLTQQTEKKFKKCKTKDGKIYDLPRRFTKRRCLKGFKGFTMKSSCTPYKYC